MGLTQRIFPPLQNHSLANISCPLMPPRNGPFRGLDVGGAKPTRGCSACNPMIVMLRKRQCDDLRVRLARAAIEALMRSPTTETDMRRTALDAYIAKKTEIDTMLALLKALSDDHFGANPEAITWATSAPSPTTPSC